MCSRLSSKKHPSSRSLCSPAPPATPPQLLAQFATQLNSQHEVATHGLAPALLAGTKVLAVGADSLLLVQRTFCSFLTCSSLMRPHRTSSSSSSSTSSSSTHAPWVESLHFGQLVDPSHQDNLDGNWHAPLNMAQLDAIRRIDSSIRRQQALAASIPQAQFHLAPTTVVPPPHMFTGGVKHLRVAVACWLAGEDVILARLLADPNCQGTVARRWRSFLQGKLHRTTPAPAAGLGASNVPLERRQAFSQHLASFVPANLADVDDDGNDSVFGRDSEFKNGFVLIQDAITVDLHGVPVNFARSFGKPINEADVYSWGPVAAWVCREVLARHHIYDLARFIHRVQKTPGSIDRLLREVLAIWDGDYGNNGLVPNVGAINPLVSSDWPTRRVALFRFAHVMALWPCSTPLGSMMESLLADGGADQISEDSGWRFEAAVWRFYAQTFFDCRRHAPVLPVPMKVPREGLPWSRRCVESLSIARCAHIRQVVIRLFAVRSCSCRSCRSCHSFLSPSVVHAPSPMHSVRRRSAPVSRPRPRPRQRQRPRFVSISLLPPADRVLRSFLYVFHIRDESVSRYPRVSKTSALGRDSSDQRLCFRAEDIGA